MNDAINREDTIGAILSIGHIAELSDGDAVIRVSAVNHVLGNLPSADVQQVVRCKDCTEYQEKFRWCKLHDGKMQSEDFCSYGERKDG